jgi:hypothetical protein
MVMPDLFIDHDSQPKQLAEAGLSAKDIVSVALTAMGIATTGARATPTMRATQGAASVQAASSTKLITSR